MSFRNVRRGATPREIEDAVNRLYEGKLNCVLASFTLTANAASTTLDDPRITAGSYIDFQPLTANAAAEKGGTALYISSQGNQTATVAHANNAQADRTFRVLIIG